jgi:hypothetical protein
MNTEVLERCLLKQTYAEETALVEQWMNDNNIAINDLQKILLVPESTKLMLSLDTDKDWETVK